MHLEPSRAGHGVIRGLPARPGVTLDLQSRPGTQHSQQPRGCREMGSQRREWRVRGKPLTSSRVTWGTGLTYPQRWDPATPGDRAGVTTCHPSNCRSSSALPPKGPDSSFFEIKVQFRTVKWRSALRHKRGCNQHPQPTHSTADGCHLVEPSSDRNVPYLTIQLGSPSHVPLVGLESQKSLFCCSTSLKFHR